MVMTELERPKTLMVAAIRISDVVRQWAEHLPDHPALVESTGTWTYRQLASAVSETESWLRELSVRPGDRVMIVGENCRAFVAILLASAGIDAWPVLVNARLSGREIDEILDHCGARRVFYTASASPHAADHAKRSGASFEERKGFGSVGIGPLQESVEPEPLEASVSDRVAALIYTSGTTGLPKGVMLSHRNLLFMAEGSAKIRSVSPGDRLYGVLPLSHAVGLSVVLLGALVAGASVYLTPRFDPMTARVTLEKERLTLLLGTPAIFNQLLQYAKLRKISSLKFPVLRIISSSGAPLDPITKSGIESLFGMVLHNGYGVTECSPTIALTRPEAPRTDTSIGAVFPGVEVKFVDSDGHAVAPGAVGELRVRGPNVMKGYYRAPEETGSAIDAEGWFNTRDLARLEDGNLVIVGRAKDLIIHKGFNVYPAEVEAVLNSHPAVVQSAVVGRSVEGDEEIVAFVQTSPEAALTPVDVAKYAEQRLARYKRPSKIVILTEMPTTATGKIAKGVLKKVVEGSEFEVKIDVKFKISELHLTGESPGGRN
ncbi:Long-chain-fatty-acid--CoA ligase [Candidatus Sulfotelmatobacter kueseliae]|uniref:Long-chain-fatty-acid--CoA ligase n=1 Tax=Candidatus Sulfotelmatobacter kueseliae TaxID=2042962 RepID=A0A2U3KKK3_9BACT|nr:Long-chain-fatty-acid--CoA ligase [Candidatus Sulfotelmatobacter kueseliae]